MKTNVLNDLSNVVKKGTGLACSWSQVGRMSEGGAIEHPLSTHSAPFGIRWKPAGEKGSTRVWKHVAMIFAVLVMSMANISMAWGAITPKTITSSTGEVYLVTPATMNTYYNSGNGWVTNASGGAISSASYYTAKTGSNNTNYINPETETSGTKGTGSGITLKTADNRSARFYFTGAVKASAFIAITGSGRTATITIYKVSDNSSVGSATTASYGSSGPYEKIEVTGLSSSESYYAKVTATNDLCLYAVKFFAPAAAGSTWYVKGDWNSWGTTDNLTGSGTELSATVNITTAGKYEFKIFDSTSSGTWWGNGGNIGCNVSGWTFESPGSNCTFFASETGNYTFTFNTSTKALSVTYPTAQGKYYYKNTGSWGTVAVYRYVGGINNGWPGTQVVETETICGDTYYFTYADPGTTLIFNNNGGGSQTGNMAASGNAGKYVSGTGSSWNTFPTYTVTYNKNGDGAGGAGSVTGSVPTDSNSPYACGSTVTVLGNTGSLAKDGYNFIGWNTAPGGGGTSYVADATFTISANTTLYAQWELIPTYDITYNANEGTGTTASQTGNLSGAVVATRANGFTRSGYKFKWWNTAANGSGEDFYPGENLTIASSNVTLYAQWEQVESGWAYWVGDVAANNATTDVTGNGTTMRLTRSSTSSGNVDWNTGLTASSTVVSQYSSTAKHAKVLAVATNDQYLQVHFTDGSPINSLKLGVAAKDDGDYEMVVIYSTTADFSSGVGEKVAHNTPRHSQTSKSVTDFSPSTENKYFYARIYRNLTSAIYSLTGGSAHTIRIYSIKAEKGTLCIAPSALGAASPTAKGVTLTVTDAANTNDYEFYVSTSSTAPEAGATATHSVSSAKSLTITNLVAGTTYYAWARSVCGVSNKSGWTALTGNTFTTSTVTMTSTLTNVTHTSGATSGIGGSDYTAVFTANTGYSMPNPTVTIGGNAATSGTDYTWSVDGAVGTITIPANKINGNIAITLNSAKAAPSSVTVDGTWHRFPGETITLTAEVTGGNGPKTYQWYKGEDAIVGATSATYTKASCAYADAGDYWCTVTCGGTESTSSGVFQVKILRLYVKTGRYDGYEKADYGNVDFTKVDGSTATASINLGANWDYCFNIADGCGHAYGYADEITVDDCTDWTINVNNQDCGLRSTNGAYYLFTIDYSAFPNMVLTVTYPTGDQAADKIIYFDNQTVNWSTLHYRVGKTNHTQATAMTKVPGTNNLWKVTTTEYLGFAGWHIANNAGWTGDNNSIYRTYTNGDQYSITYATAHEGGAVTQAAVTVTPTTWKDKGGDAGINDNCDFYNYSITSGMKTQNVAISPYSNGTITVNYTNTSNVASTLTSGNADLAHTVILTSITAVPNTGYDASAITINGGAYSANYVVTGATTIAASFTPHTYSITYKDQGDAAFSGTHVDSPNAHPTSHTYATATTLNSATKTGYTFGGWYTNSACTGEAVASLGATAFSADITLYAKWTVNNYNLTWNLGGGTTTSAGTGIASGVSVNTTSSVAYGTSLTAPTVTKTGYNFSAWSPAVASTMPAEATTYTATWTAATYTVTLNTNGGTINAGNVTSYTYGTGATLPTNVTKDGFTFGGWYDNSGLTGSAVTTISTTATGNKEYWAKWTAAASLTALVANTLYEVPDMIPSGASLTSSDQFFDGLSANTKFELIGSGSGSTTPKVNNNSSNDKTIDGITFDDGSMWFKGNASLTSNIPTTFGLSFIVPEGGGKLYLYFSGTSTNIKLAKSGSSGSKPSCPNGYGEVDVTAGTYYLYGTGTTAPYCFYGLKLCSKYSVSITTTNVTKATGDATAVHGKAYTATFTANTGYTLPSDATVSIGGTPQTKGTGYTWTISAGTATLTIPAAYVTGNIVVSVAGVAAVTHDVSFSLTNVVYSSGNNQGTGAATEGSAFSTVFAASSGYSLPGTITVTIGGVEQTAGTGYTWAQGSGTLTIPAAYVTDDIVVTIVGEEMEGDGCDELVHTEAATATTLTTTVGSATLTNPSGQTANDKAIKLNSSGYIELSPKAGKSFAAGDSLIIVMWNQASSAKTTGYRIAGTDYTASMPSKVNTTFRRKLIAADIVSSKVKIERESANGSNAYFVSAIIKHCEDLPSCTTPSLPTLSNQTVCPGSDIAAWDATPTNIATITGASEDVAYSWKKKGSDTELAATASFDLGSSATEGMAGTYVVTVTVSKTGYISKSASAEVDLTVTPATETPSVTASKAKVYATDEVTLTATCGSTGVTWNWYLCANSDGTGAGSSLGTSATYTIASAPAAGTYYYKAVATGDGTHSCGTAEYVYTLVVSAANSCDKEFWFAKEGDRPTGAAAATHITGCPSGSSSASYTASIDGTNYTLTGSTGQKTGDVTIVVPADNTGTLYVVVQGSSSRTITLSKGGTQIGQETPENSTWGVFTFDDLDAGTYTLVSSGNISWAMMALKLCPTAACTDDTPTATATNATVCAGGSITITATGYETGATFQWQKQNASTSVWEDIDGATSATYTVATAAAEHAGNYHIVATKGCARTSNTVTIAVPSAPVFNSFTTTRRIMETQALSISDVSATDAVSYTWYKSADATWDAGDTEIGTSKNLLKPYAGETAGSTYYVFCRAANSCGTTTSTAITVTVQTLIEEDCAIAGNSGEHNTFAKTGNVSSGTYGSITELHTNSNNKYIYYTAESGYYFAKATVNACVGNASDLPTAAYSYSTDGGANWTDQNLTGMTTAYTDHVINLPANVNAFRVGRRLGDCGTSSNTIYIHQVCFEYNENCTKTTVNPSSAAVDYEIGDPFTAPTFTVKHNNVALSPQPTITYTSSDETVATVDDDGTVNFQDKAGTVVITAAYAGDATYCESEGSYTITVSCSDEAPKIIAADGTNIGGCNDEITLEAKKQDGTTNFSDGTYQWYRDGEAISGATGRTYTVSLTGVYSVERTSVGGCVSPSSNKATVTSESAEPEVERLTPFQYYHVDKVYAETSIMRFRHLFAVKNAGTTLEGKHFKMELSRNGGAASDVTNSNAFVMSADTVLLDMNKLYDKYEEDDELVLTCSAVDCEGNVSSIYKNTITIYVIDETPTLALICSGASGDGTRKTSNLVVGGDFLTGYNKADLCVQTGNTSFDKTQEWVLYTRLKENYIVTPVNGYAEFNKLNYEPFDILFLTDYPKASKSDAAATILDDMADLCDYRPLFTFKTHMVHKSPSKWAAKGFMAQPEVPKQSRLRLNIVCYAHPMFDDLKETSDHIQKDASDHSQIVYTMLTGAGHEGGKGMQGFPIDAAEGFVTIGLVHYDATAADDTPSDGYVTWTSGSSDVMMVAAAERQVNLEARMILFSINCGAQSKLTETGRQVVLKSLEYLLSDATITPVADCSFTFTNGAGNDWTYEQYKAKCPACTGTIGDGKWSTAGNWGPDWILQPGKDTEVKIAAPVTVDMPHAKVRTVRILEGGSIDIPAGSGLEVGSTIRRLDGTELSPTEVVDLSIGSTSSGNGTLIFNNNAGDTKAGVAMYSKGFIDYTDPSKPKGIKNYQYIGVPCVNINAAYNYYGSWIYSWSDKGDSYGWQKVVNGGIVTTWTGYCITQESAGTYYAISGTLAATNTVDIDVPAGENMVVGNSWTAPIYIKEFTDDDFENLLGNVYFFNTGVDQDYTSGHEQDLGDRYASSTYVTVPIHSSPYTGDSLISSMQGFFVKSNGSAGALHLDYDRHVRPSTNRNILSGVMHAPRRANAQSDEPAVLKIKVSGENYDDKLLLLAREDFSMGFDNGWDGDKWDGNESALYIYTKDEAGTENSVSAIPEMEGTVIGFRAGEDDAYTLHFEYLNSAEELYLFDTETNAYTKIMTGATYRFFTDDKEKHERFVITRKSPQIATDVDEVDSGKRREVRKLLIEDKMYILVNGMLYDATGKVVK